MSSASLAKRLWFSSDEISLLGLSGENDCRDFISQRAYQTMRDRMDTRHWAEVLRNKLLCHHFLTANGLPTPRLHGYFHHRDGTTASGAPLRSGSELMGYLEREGLLRVALKNVTGGTGDSVLIGRVDASALLLPDGQRLGAEAINQFAARYEDGFIVEEVIEPAEGLAAVTDGGFISIRMQTLRLRDGQTKLQCAFIRLGMPGQLTDHAFRGAVMASVELETGALGDACSMRSDRATPVNLHPASGRRIKGVVIPAWEDCKATVLRAAAALPGVHFIGWDVNPGRDGPVLIEGNVGNVVSVYQRLIGGFVANGIAEEWAEHLGVELPDASLGWRMRHWDKSPGLTRGEYLLGKLIKPVVRRLWP
jgi:hypothetical protein